MTMQRSHKTPSRIPPAQRLFLQVAAFAFCLATGPIAAHAGAGGGGGGAGGGAGAGGGGGPACTAGLPCVTPLTVNDPTKDDDGPDLGDAPNKSKIGDNDQTCDADLMNQIYARAYLESQRDTLKAQILIRKPDSVMEYTCFDEQARMAGAQGGALFSHSDYWNPGIVPITSDFGVGMINDDPIPFVMINVDMGADRLQDSIKNLILTSLGDYIKSNFNHTFLGGSSSLDYKASDDGGGILGGLGGGGGLGGLGGGDDNVDYDCTYMNQVYQLAKCSDIVTDDHFWTFKELIDPDPRLLPEQCKGTQITQDKIDVSNNKDFKYVAFDKVDPAYTKLMQPGDPCADPIPTGLIVTDKKRKANNLLDVTIESTDTYNDAVCPNPGCHFTGKDNKCTP